MALSPLFRMNDAGDGVTKVRAHRHAHLAVTKYRVLDSSSGCSLVELQPLTGTKTCFFFPLELVTRDNFQNELVEYFFKQNGRIFYLPDFLHQQEPSTR